MFYETGGADNMEHGNKESEIEGRRQGIVRLCTESVLQRDSCLRNSRARSGANSESGLKRSQL